MTNDAAVAWVVVVNGEPDFADIRKWECEREAAIYGDIPGSILVEPLYSATTVAELRAEIDALRGEVERRKSAQAALSQYASAAEQRADAAERRVAEAEQKLAEVVEAAIDFLEAADARDNEEVSTQYPDHEKRLRQYKAAREDLNAILPGPTP